MTPAPYYVAPGAPSGGRRLLLITPAFPPCAEVGALRWEKLAGVAAERGWTLDVITGAAAPQDRFDAGRLKSLPAGTRVWTIPLQERLSERLQRRLWAMRASLFRQPAIGAAGEHALPRAANEGDEPSTSARIGALARTVRARHHFTTWIAWCDEVQALARAIAAEQPPDVVVSSGPPHMAHEAARRSAHVIGRPFVIDLRDPWFVDHAEPASLASRTWRQRTERYEATACREAALVVVNTQASAKLLRDRYPAIVPKLLTVMNGADPEVALHAADGDDFLIMHAGNLYGGRDPRVLFRSIRTFLDGVSDTPHRIRVEFIGGQTYMEVPLSEIARQERIDDVFSSRPPLPRDEALRAVGRAAVLIVLPQEWSFSVPAKVFEYMQFRAGMLVLCEPDDATAQLLRGTSADLVRPDDCAAITAVLARRYDEWRRALRPQPVNADGRFDRHVQASLLLDALERIG